MIRQIETLIPQPTIGRAGFMRLIENIQQIPFIDDGNPLDRLYIRYKGI